MYIPRIILQVKKYREELNANDKLIYSALSSAFRHEDNSGKWVELTRRELSEELGMSEATVKRSMRRLAEIGLISEVRRGLGMPNKIYILEHKL